MNRAKKLVAIDLFCGCGGMSKGLEMAGVDVVAGFDVDKKYISSFEKNFARAAAVVGDIARVSPEDFARVVMVRPGEIDFLVGGPPCQGFSKNVPRKFRRLEDPKNTLVSTFLHYVRYLMPRYVVMENVAEMRGGFDGHYTEEVMQQLQGAGYDVEHFSLNAADYGVPQLRKRAFFIASRDSSLISIPIPTHSASAGRTDDLFKLDRAPHVSVWDAISDLPSLANGEGCYRLHYATKANSCYQSMMRNESGIVTNHIARKLRALQYERISCLSPGEGMKDLPPHLRTKGGYSGAYGRLTKEMVAPTITRWVFHPGSGRWGHPVDLRLITMRETARIQGFPDDFDFVGTYNEQAGQLGNAVPPLLMKAVVETLLGGTIAQRESSSSASVSNDSFSVPLGS